MYAHLFQQGRIGGMVIKNRLVRAPMVLNWAGTDGQAGDRHLAHIERCAEGGVGAITLEASYVSPEGRGFGQQLGIHSDEMIDGLSRLAKAAHAHGARIGVQLYHAGRQTTSAVTGQTLMAPSALPCPLLGGEPRALSVEQIAVLVEQFGAAAARAQAAGLDFVEIHGAHGYLVAQFLSAASNRREDGYGGSLDNRTRFLREIVESVRTRTGADFPVLVRISGEEQVDGGLTIDETVEICRRMQAWGVDAVDISCGAYGSYVRGRMIPPMAVPDGPLVALAERVRAAVSIPVITVGKIRSPEMADRLVAEGAADFIALGRSLLTDPDWPRRAEAGEAALIDPCIACNQGCIGRLFGHADVWCLANPETGRERDFAVAGSPAPGKLAVVGGGPAGMAAAIWARRRGREVVLFEQADRLGGDLFLAAAPPHRPGWDELRRSFARRVRKAGVEVRLGATASAEDIRRCGADAVVVAVGAAPRGLDPSWTNRAIQAEDLLSGRRSIRGSVVVIGGGCSGAQTAEFLAEAGCRVTIVEASDTVADDAPLDDRALLLERLRRLDVVIRAATTVVGVDEDAVHIEHRGVSSALPADHVVACLGSDARDSLAAALAELQLPVLVVGDCRAPRRVTEAVYEGAWAGFHLENAP